MKEEEEEEEKAITTIKKQMNEHYMHRDQYLHLIFFK